MAQRSPEELGRGPSGDFVPIDIHDEGAQETKEEIHGLLTALDRITDRIKCIESGDDPVRELLPILYKGKEEAEEKLKNLGVVLNVDSRDENGNISQVPNDPEMIH